MQRVLQKETSEALPQKKLHQISGTLQEVLIWQMLGLCCISINQPHPLSLQLQNADLNKFQALTFLYLHSNNLTELPHGEYAITVAR